MINTLLANGPQAVRAAKQVAFDIVNKDIDQTLLSQTSELIASMRVSSEGQEGLSAFFEKRVPQWQAQSTISTEG